jgi:transposase-like protein
MSARLSHAATRQLWSERITRFKSSTATIAQFCATEGCSQASFYQWRRKLRSEAPNTQSPAIFVPVKLTEQAAGQTEFQHRRCEPAQSHSTVMSVQLPGGIRVRIEVAAAEQVIA